MKEGEDKTPAPSKKDGVGASPETDETANLYSGDQVGLLAPPVATACSVDDGSSALDSAAEYSDNPDDMMARITAPTEVFVKFTTDSYERLLIREEEEKKKALEKKNKPNEGRLVDGELKFDGEESEEPVPKRDPALVEGNILPESLGTFPKQLAGVPLEDIDPYLKEKTFVVIASRFNKRYIHRFTATKGFFLFSPWNPVRRLMVYIATYPLFDYLVILTILLNCVFLALTTQQEISEYVFLGIYTVECLVKVLARGFVLNKYTYLRDPWNWLDFGVILIGYITIILKQSSSSDALDGIAVLRTFRVFRALKTVSIVPGLKTIVNALLKSMKMLLEVLVLILFVMTVFALFALQVYMGSLRQKCVFDLPADANVTDIIYSQHIKDPNNWVEEDGDYLLCGNATGAGPCPENSTCLPSIGENLNFGYTNYDHFGWAMLNSFQLITLDFWEDQYDKILRANGPANIIYFWIIVFFGSFYLINLMLAVVSMSYEEEATSAGKEKEKEKKNKKDSLSFDATKLKIHKIDLEEKRRKEKEKAEKKERKKRKKKKIQDKEKASMAHQLDMHHLQVVDVHSMYSSSNGSLRSVYSNGHLKTSNGSLQHSNVDMQNGINCSKTSIKNYIEANMNSPKPVFTNNNNSGTTQVASPLNSPTAKTPLDGAADNPDPHQNRRYSRRMSEVSVLRLLQQGSDGIVNPAGPDQDNLDEPPLIVVEKDEDTEQYVDHNCGCCERCCVNYVCWLRFQNNLEKMVMDPFFEMFITFCIILNTILMATEHHGMPNTLTELLKYSNYVFIAIFTLEAILKLLALSKAYFKNAWNIFDLFIVAVSVLDLVISELELDNIPNLSVFRSFKLVRLMRIFRLAQSWSTMRLLLSIIISTLGALGNLTVVLIIIMYIFAVIGMQLFQYKYTPAKFAPDEVPRWHFDDFGHAFMLIFRVLCGEWIEPMWDCMRAEGEICMVVFIPTLILGNFMVLNLFLALLLNAFASDTLRSAKEKDDKPETGVSKGWKQLKNLFKARSAMVGPVTNRKAIEAGETEVTVTTPAEVSMEEGKLDGEKKVITDGEVNNEIKANETKSEEPKTENKPDTKIDNKTEGTSNGALKNKPLKDVDEAFKTQRGQFAEFNSTVAASRKNAVAPSSPTVTIDKPPEDVAREEQQKKEQQQREQQKRDQMEQAKLDEITEEPPVVPPPTPKSGQLVRKNTANELNDNDNTLHDCFPAIFYIKCKCFWRFNDSTPYGRRWYTFRRTVHRFTEHKAFEYTILAFIVLSSLALCFEDVYLDDNPVLKEVLTNLDIAFCVIFTLEMLLKWIGMGWKKYFTSFWTILDFAIVVVSIVSLIAEAVSSGNAGQISALRSLRTLRSLRPLRAISRWEGMRIVVNALMHAIPAIFNVLMVCLLFWTIFSIAGVQLFGGKFAKCIDENGTRVLHTTVPNKTVCLQRNMTWKHSDINFNNVFSGLLALFQIATFEGWMEIMIDAIDMTEVDVQPIRENSAGYYVYFVIFIIFGAFFTLNLFIGVIIDNFNMLKKKYEGGYLDMFLTQGQRNYYNTLKRLSGKKPQKTIKRPKNEFMNRIQGFFFDISISSKFELAIVFLIFLNMASMGIEHYNQSQTITDVMEIINIIFTTIFTLEAIVKIIGLRWHYFRRAWNVYDFIIVILSIIGVIIDDIIRTVFITPTLLRVVRVFRIGRVLRLIKVAKGIRKLLFALVISLPALFNIGMLLLLLMFIYSIFGMSSFGNVKRTVGMNDLVNFETFIRSFILLFRLTTSAGWNEILEPLMVAPPFCDTQQYTRTDGKIITAPNGECGDPGLAIFFMFTFTLITYLIVINMFIAVILENFNQAHEQEEVGLTEDDFEMFYVVWERYDPHASQFIKYEYLSDFIGDLEEPLGIAKPNEIAIVAFDLPIVEGDKLHCLDVLIALVKHVLGDIEQSVEFKELKNQMDEKFSNQFPTRVTTEVKSSTMKRKKMDVAARTLQRAWRKHKLQKNMRQLMEMALEERSTLERSHTKESFGRKLSGALGSAFRSLSRPSSAKSRSNISLKNPEGSNSRRPSAVNNTLKVPTNINSPRVNSGNSKVV